MVDSALLGKAVAALLKHHNEGGAGEDSGKKALLGNDLPIHVHFTLERIPQQTSSKPHRVEIPHPLHKLGGDDAMDVDDGLDEVEVCIIVKDDSKEYVQEMIENFPTYLSHIKKVLTLTSLRKKYTQYKDRRDLLKRYNFFMADDRILPMVGKALGKNFFQEKKQPIPIKITRKEALPYAVKKCLSSTFLWVSPGSCLSVKAGTTGMPMEHLVKNVAAICAKEGGAVGHIPRRWSNITAINIKTSQSVALPVYNKTREELSEIAKLAKVDSLVVATTAAAGKKGTKDKKRARELETEKNSNDNDDEAAVVAEKKKHKKELAAKSPLVKALKKQKKKEEAEAEKVVAATPKSKSTTKRKKRSDSVDKVMEKIVSTPKSSKKKKIKEAVDDEPAEPVVATPKSSKKKKSKEAAVEKPAEPVVATPKSSKKKKSKEAAVEKPAEPVVATPKSSKKKKSKEAVVEKPADPVVATPKSSKKSKEAAVEKPEAATPKAKAPPKDFYKIKKFKGSKKGFCFKMGEKGLGYYRDVVPAVDKSLLKGGRGRSSGGGDSGKKPNRSKSGGRRGRR